MASKGSDVTDPQTPDLLREAGIQLKARHNFLTLLAHKRVNTGWHTVLNSTTQTGQDRVLRDSGRGRRPLKAKQATSLSGVTERAGLPHPPAAILLPSSSLHCNCLRWAHRDPPVAQPPIDESAKAPLSSVSLLRPCLSLSPVSDASLLLANQAQDIHLAANSGHLYHLHTNVIIANLLALPTLSSH